MCGFGRRTLAASLLGAILAAAPSARAQPALVPGVVDSAATDEALAVAERDLAASRDARDRLAAEIATLKGDAPRLSAALVEAARRADEAEARVAGAETRLVGLSHREADLARSLETRRALVAEVLAALQRLGRARPPALLGLGGDAGDAVRGGLLLGAAVPDLTAEAQAVAADLGRLREIRTDAEAERAALARAVAGFAAERTRLFALVDARRDAVRAGEAGLSAETARAEALGRTVVDLRGLADALAHRSGALLAEAETARRARDEAARRLGERALAVLALPPVPLAPRTPFAEARGQLSRPAGTVIRGFGEPDGQGGTARGVSVAARPRAVVTAPADGRVMFSGPFRSYGNVLILDPGGGYYVLLAGLERVDVVAGQSVLAGEPVGAMGGVRAGGAVPSAAPAAVEGGRPVLYVEFRKGGVPIDPGPWWLKSQGEKVRG